MRSVVWRDGVVAILNQRLLPHRMEYIECNSYERVAQAIEHLEVRGAPAIGVAAAMGVALAAFKCEARRAEELASEVKGAINRLRHTRPTAKNLFWALDRMEVLLKNLVREGVDIEEIKDRLVKEALKMAEEDVQTNRTIGRNGAVLLDDEDTVLTHCNAGALACVDYGTALGVIRGAVEAGKRIRVIATETRPLLQGARLTTFELLQDGIDVTLITDNMVGYVMKLGMVDKVIVGADRILRDGHVINKIGTYTIAVLAREHGIPFYVAAPWSTFDLETKPEEVVIEERDASEVTEIAGVRIAPQEVKVFNPAFDITPPEYISAIITERGVFKPPYDFK
ncbi:MAG: S-methyl-5-thioribose-1-phosphate isomerase [Candidatus Verstraetearchaeota archaeon]|nr:S-methyl-5-thioribose-1-phosphate isomerase [Candidatus Verstraetearchaeota archaeon]